MYATLYAPYVERFDRAPATETDFADLYPYNEYKYGWFGTRFSMDQPRREPG
jgi:hypothetical protein